jgi:hypothetical protein
MPSLEIEFTLEQLNAVVKSVSTSVTVAVKKMQRIDSATHQGRIAKEEYVVLAEALDILRDAEHYALVGED